MKELKMFGLRLKNLRKQRGLSQEKLSEKIEISSKYMSRIELGLHFPSMEILVKLADALNVEMEDIFNFSHEIKNIRELKKQLNKLLEGADEGKLKLAVKVMKAVMR
jgi:transcriptional regulator with XRE-family HTH domain